MIRVDVCIFASLCLAQSDFRLHFCIVELARVWLNYSWCLLNVDGMGKSAHCHFSRHIQWKKNNHIQWHWNRRKVAKLYIYPSPFWRNNINKKDKAEFSMEKNNVVQLIKGYALLLSVRFVPNFSVIFFLVSNIHSCLFPI